MLRNLALSISHPVPQCETQLASHVKQYSIFVCVLTFLRNVI